MKTTLLTYTILATLAIFSTITGDVYAQKTSIASMTVRATVVQSASMISMNDMVFSPFTVNDSGQHVSSSTKAEFILSGSVGSEINISMNAPETLNDEDGNSIYFKPLVKIGNNEISGFSNVVSNVNLMGQTSGYYGKSSVWIEGLISSNEEMANSKYSGDYLVSVSYN